MKPTLACSILMSVFTLFSVTGRTQVLGKESLSADKTQKTKVFLSTDKEIYAPGETLQFTARLYDCQTGNRSDEQELIIMIKGKGGEIITDQNYSVEGGIVTETLVLPAWAHEGLASVVAFSPSNMVNNEAPLVAIQPILINALKKNDYLITLQNNDKIVKPGDEVELELFITQITPGNSKEKMTLSLVDFKGVKYTSKCSLHLGLNKVKVKIPQEFEDGLWVEIESAAKHFGYLQFPLKTTADKINIEFFPEGGHLLANSVQRIVYRATNAFGEPLTLGGKIFDPTGHHVGLGKSLKPGLGLISLMPMPGQVYTFEIEGSYGAGNKFVLPETLTDGVAISYLKTDNRMIRNQIRVVGRYQSQTLTIGVAKNQEVLWAQPFAARGENKMEIPADDFPKGILTFQVRDSLGTILSQRMIYNGEPLPEGSDLKPEIEFTKGEDIVSLKADVGNILKQWPGATFDLKIVDQNTLINEMAPYHPGYLRYPLFEVLPQTVLDFYIANIELIGNLFHPACVQSEFPVCEHKTSTISGLVSDKKGRPVTGAKVMAFPPDRSAIWNTTSDENGLFTIEGIGKSTEVKIKALDQSGKQSFVVKLYHNFQESLDDMIQLASFRIKSFYNPEGVVRYFNQNRNLIREFQSEMKTRDQSANVERMLKSGSSILDVIRMMKAYDIQSNQIVFYGSANSFNFQSGALIVIDGQKMGTDISALNSVSPHDVVSISVSTDPMDIQKYTGLNSVGVIEIVTRGSFAGNGLPNAKDMGKANEQDQPEQTTRLWMPDLQPVNGKISQAFFPGRLKTGFVICIDAIAPDGQTVSFSEVYKDE